MKTRISDLFDSYEGETAPVGAPPADPGRILALTTEKIKLETPKRRRWLRAMVIAAAAALLLGGTVVASSNGMAQRLEEYWNSLTGSAMSAEQQELVNSMTSSVGQSQTRGGVTVTVDSVVRGSRQVWVLLDVAFPEPRPDVTCVSFSQPMSDDSLGTVLYGSGDSSRVSDSMWQIVCEFDLADNASTGPDTDFTLRLGRLLVCTEDSDESSESDDAWTFSFALPVVADAQSADSDEPVQFEDAEITDISVTESGCSFKVTPTDVRAQGSYDGAGDSTELSTATAAIFYIPHVSEYAVSAVLTDGTAVAVGSISARDDTESGDYECTVDWAAPIDVSQLDRLVFTDLFASGAPEISVSVG